MALPHPESRKDQHRKEDVPSWSGVIGQFFKRTIDVTEDRNAEDDVNPAEDRTLGAFFHDGVLSEVVLMTVASCLNIFAQPNSAPLSA